MHAIVDYFVRRHFLVNVMVAVVVLLGIKTAMTSEREGFPAVTLNQLIVSAKLPGASASDIERKVTHPIEEAIDELDGVVEYKTEVADNLSITTIEYDDAWGAVEIRQAEADLRQALDAIPDFPDDMRDRPVVQRVEADKFPILEIALAGASEDLPIAAERIEARLATIPGVGTTTAVGVEDPELRVLLDPTRARAHGVTLGDVIAAIDARNVTGTGGLLERNDARKQVILSSRYHDPHEVGETVVAVGREGELVRIRDVARVELARRDQGLRVHTNARPGASVVVRKKSGADILDTVDAIKAALAELELPAGVEVTLVNDSSFMTRNRLQLMASNGLIGMVLVIAMLLIFLDRRSAFWVAFGVPVVILGVIALLPQLGMTINLMTLAGFVIVLGMLVDDAVVVAERIVTMQQGGFGKGPRASVRGVMSVARPVIASSVTTILAFSPLFSLGGTPGKFAWNIPVVVILALAISLAESFIMLPAHMTPLEEDPPEPGESPDASASVSARAKAQRPEGVDDDEIEAIERAVHESSKPAFVRALERAYRAVLMRLLKLRWLVLVAFLAILVVTMGVVRPRMGFNLFPQDDSEALFIKIALPQGAPLEQTEAVASAIERQLPILIGDDLQAVTARIGHRDGLALDRQTGAASHEAVVSVLFHPLGRARTSEQWAAILHERIVVPADVDLVFEPKRLGPPVGRPVTLHVAANDDELRRASALAAAQWLAQVPGVVDIEIDERPGIRQIDLDLDHDKLAMRGLDARSVSTTLTAAFHGIEVSEHRDLAATTRFRVQLEPAARTSLDDLLDLQIRTRTGTLVPLRDLVHPVEVAAVSRILHRDGVRTATVSAGFAPGSGLDANTMAARIEGELIPGLLAASPSAAKRGELRPYLGGEATQTKKTTKDLQIAGVVAIIGITLVIALILESFLDAMLVISVIPFGAAGVILAFAAHGRPLSMFAMMGIIGLAGVVVNSAIVMVDAIKQRWRAHANDGLGDRNDLMVEAVVERLRPVLVTTLTTCGGVFPTAYGLGGYDAMLSPMSLALGWGLVFATLITLVLVPCLVEVGQDVRRLASGLYRVLGGGWRS
jgi:multidrug efflux pump subunit AcrB